MGTLTQHNVPVLYRRKSVSADDNLNCFCRILMICNVCIVLAKTLNDIWIRMLYHMNYAHNVQAYELHISAIKISPMIVQLCRRWDILRMGGRSKSMWYCVDRDVKKS